MLGVCGLLGLAQPGASLQLRRGGPVSGSPEAHFPVRPRPSEPPPYWWEESGLLSGATNSKPCELGQVPSLPASQFASL